MRHELPAPLVPRQPKTGLGWAMQKFRQVSGTGVRELAREYGCSASHISRVERGDTKPSRALVAFYEDRFETDGLLFSMLEVSEHAREQKRQRAATAGEPQRRAIPGDAVAYVTETVPHGTVVEPGQLFVKTWTIRNCGTVEWADRRLERQGPITGPGLITSPRAVPVPDMHPNETAEVQVVLKAPTYDCSTIAYFKMVNSAGTLCFPDEHQLGLDVLVRVVRNTGGVQ